MHRLFAHHYSSLAILILRLYTVTSRLWNATHIRTLPFSCFTGRIAALHKSGVVVRFMPHGLKGFLPWQRMDPQRLPDAATASQEDLEALKGQEVRAKVLQVRGPVGLHACVRAWPRPRSRGQ